MKTLTQSDIRDIQGIPTAMKMVMTNEIDKSETQMEFLDVKYNLDIKDALFTGTILSLPLFPFLIQPYAFQNLCHRF